jgi:polyisoprenoid-binding protein YceI
MKKIILSMTALALFAASCNNTVEGTASKTDEKQEVSTTTAGTAYNVNAATSTLTWEGAGLNKKHTGTFGINKGSLMVDGSNLTGGSFEVNVGALTNTDLTGEMQANLVKHLLSAEFFDSGKFPTANFEITKVEALTGDSTATHTISGNLKLKDSTKNVTFPAKVSITDAGVTASAKFTIDRTLWGMSYGNDQSLKDKFISPTVGIGFNINAAK